jgi:hypothetical protein
MGIPIVLALCLFAHNLIRTMRTPSGAPRESRPAEPSRLAIPPSAPRPRAFISTLPVR